MKIIARVFNIKTRDITTTTDKINLNNFIVKSIKVILNNKLSFTINIDTNENYTKIIEMLSKCTDEQLIKKFIKKES